MGHTLPGPQVFSFFFFVLMWVKMDLLSSGETAALYFFPIWFGNGMATSVRFPLGQLSEMYVFK